MDRHAASQYYSHNTGDTSALDDLQERQRVLTTSHRRLEDVDRALRHIDEEILDPSQHQHVRLALLAQHNDRLPISKLPAEIFSRVFSFCVPGGDAPDGFDHLRVPDDGVEWLAFTHVCRLWRAIAVADPTLWNHPIFGLPSLAAAMMERSRNIPLTLQWSPPTNQDINPRSEALFSRALGTGDNIRGCNIELTYAMISRYLSPISTAPLLQTLFVRSTEGNATTTFYDIPQILAPRLKMLELCHCMFPLVTNQPFPYLTSLKINLSPSPTIIGNNVRLPMNDLLNLLRNAPVIQDVELVEALAMSPISPYTSVDPSELVLAPNLIDIRIEDSANGPMLDFLLHLQLPRLRVLTVALMQMDAMEPFGQERTRELLQKLHQVAGNHGRDPWLSLLLQRNDSFDVTLRLGNSSFIHNPILLEPIDMFVESVIEECLEDYDEPEVRMELSFRFWLPQGLRQCFIEDLRDVFPLEQVRLLCADVHHGWEMLGTLPDISILMVGSRYLHSFLELLSNPSEGNPFLGVEAAIFIRIDLEESKLVEALVSYKRHHVNANLETLYFYECSVLSEEMMVELEDKGYGFKEHSRPSQHNSRAGSEGSESSLASIDSGGVGEEGGEEGEEGNGDEGDEEMDEEGLVLAGPE